MKNFVYILTDSNRRCLHVGLTDDLLGTVAFYKEHKKLFFDAGHLVSRLVYFEEFVVEESAINRFNTLATYTRTQKERLIRIANKDWHDLSLQLGQAYRFIDPMPSFPAAKIA